MLLDAGVIRFLADHDADYRDSRPPMGRAYRRLHGEISSDCGACIPPLIHRGRMAALQACLHRD